MDYYGFPLDVHLHMAIILLPILLSCLVRNLKYLAPLSAVANIFMAVGIVITLYFITQDLPAVSERNYIASVGQLPLFFGTALFAFEGIGLVSKVLSSFLKLEINKSEIQNSYLHNKDITNIFVCYKQDERLYNYKWIITT